jgi:transcriptional regulator with XRE-family HTH domain
MKKGDITNEIAQRNPEALERVKKNLAFQIGLMVMNARIRKGMTQEELAKKIGTKQPAIARIESGSSLPSLTILDKIARLGFDSYLMSPQFAFTSSFMLKDTSTTNSGIETGTSGLTPSRIDYYVHPTTVTVNARAEKNTTKQITIPNNN